MIGRTKKIKGRAKRTSERSRTSLQLGGGMVKRRQNPNSSRVGIYYIAGLCESDTQTNANQKTTGNREWEWICNRCGKGDAGRREPRSMKNEKAEKQCKNKKTGKCQQCEKQQRRKEMRKTAKKIGDKENIAEKRAHT